MIEPIMHHVGVGLLVSVMMFLVLIVSSDTESGSESLLKAILVISLLTGVGAALI